MDVSRAPLTAPRRGRRWTAAFARIARAHLLSRLDRRRVVFRWRPDAVRLPQADLLVMRATSVDQLPGTVFRSSDPEGQAREWYRHFLDQGAVLWTAVEDGRALGSVWVLDAGLVGSWYVPLEADAQVIYGGRHAGLGAGKGSCGAAFGRGRARCCRGTGVPRLHGVEPASAARFRESRVRPCRHRRKPLARSAGRPRCLSKRPSCRSCWSIGTRAR